MLGRYIPVWILPLLSGLIQDYKQLQLIHQISCISGDELYAFHQRSIKSSLPQREREIQHIYGTAAHLALPPITQATAGLDLASQERPCAMEQHRNRVCKGI